MKILYLGHGGLNDNDRIQELRLLGHEVCIEFLYPKITGFKDKLDAKIAARIKHGSWVERINNSLVERSCRWYGFDLIWITKALYVFGTTINKIKNHAKCPVVQFTPDIAIEIEGTQKSEIYMSAVPEYDAIITTKNFEVEGYIKRGAAKVIFAEKAVSHRRFYPRSNVGPEQSSDIGFIGHMEPHYQKILRCVSTLGAVRVNGPGWSKFRNRFNPLNFRLTFGGAIRGESYSRCLSGMHIGLGLLSKLGPEMITARSHEIPASGTFLLAERTPEHQRLYREGVDAEFFDCDYELIDKARFYLMNPIARETIAKSGRARFMQSASRLDRQMSITIDDLIDQFDLPQ